MLQEFREAEPCKSSVFTSCSVCKASVCSLRWCGKSWVWQCGGVRCSNLPGEQHYTEIVVTPQAEELQLVVMFLLEHYLHRHSNVHWEKYQAGLVAWCFVPSVSCASEAKIQLSKSPTSYSQSLHSCICYDLTATHIQRSDAHTYTRAHRLTHAWVQSTAEYSQKEQFASWVCVCWCTVYLIQGVYLLMLCSVRSVTPGQELQVRLWSSTQFFSKVSTVASVTCYSVNRCRGDFQR